jgi:UDP-N-acetylmuramoyl-L-alanyl-D-glutamate--2,6-diaminopimelate ligase
MDAYFAAKAQLFDRVLPEEGTAVVNLDDPAGPGGRAQGRRCRGSADRRPERARRAAHARPALRRDRAGPALLVERRRAAGAARPDRRLPGRERPCRRGPLHRQRVDPRRSSRRCRNCVTVRGRMQHVATRDNGATVFVDYAHTPDALATALRRCGRMSWAGSSSSSARAATATGEAPADGARGGQNADVVS